MKTLCRAMYSKEILYLMFFENGLLPLTPPRNLDVINLKNITRTLEYHKVSYEIF
jgi:hypothetical protein